MHVVDDDQASRIETGRAIAFEVWGTHEPRGVDHLVEICRAIIGGRMRERIWSRRDRIVRARAWIDLGHTVVRPTTYLGLPVPFLRKQIEDRMYESHL